MRFAVSSLAILAAVGPVAVSAQAPKGSNYLCIGKCFLDNDDLGFMNGECDDSTSVSEIEACICKSMRESDFFACAVKCPKKEQEDYEKDLADAGGCENLFSGSSGSSKDDSDDDKDDSKNDGKSDGDDDDDDDDSKPTAPITIPSMTDKPESSSTDASESNPTSMSKPSSTTDDSSPSSTTGSSPTETDAASRNAPALFAAGAFAAAFLI